MSDYSSNDYIGGQKDIDGKGNYGLRPGKNYGNDGESYESAALRAGDGLYTDPKLAEGMPNGLSYDAKSLAGGINDPSMLYNSRSDTASPSQGAGKGLTYLVVKSEGATYNGGATYEG